MRVERLGLSVEGLRVEGEFGGEGEGPGTRREQAPLPKHAPGMFGTVLDLRTTTSQKCEAVPRRARIQGS